MTREEILAHIAENLSDVAAAVGVAVTDEQHTFNYVISDAIQWANGDDSKLLGLTNYFAYRLFYAKQVTVGITPTDDFMKAMQGTADWCVNAGYEFDSHDDGR